MPEFDTRVVVLGTPKADKQFEVFDAERIKAIRDADKVDKEIKRLRGELRRIGVDLRNRKNRARK